MIILKNQCILECLPRKRKPVLLLKLKVLHRKIQRFSVTTSIYGIVPEIKYLDTFYMETKIIYIIVFLLKKFHKSKIKHTFCIRKTIIQL